MDEYLIKDRFPSPNIDQANMDHPKKPTYKYTPQLSRIIACDAATRPTHRQPHIDFFFSRYIRRATPNVSFCFSFLDSTSSVGIKLLTVMLII